MKCGVEAKVSVRGEFEVCVCACVREFGKISALFKVFRTKEMT